MSTDIFRYGIITSRDVGACVRYFAALSAPYAFRLLLGATIFIAWTLPSLKAEERATSTRVQVSPPQSFTFTSASPSPPAEVVGTQNPGPRPTRPGARETTGAGETRTFRILPANGPPRNEAQKVASDWLARAARLEGFTQSTPKEGAAATEETRVYVGYDKENLYVVFYCYDGEPSLVRANYSKRDDIQSDDYVGIILDTFNDGRRAYKFLVNPLGVQADSLWTEESGDDWSFDMVFQTRAEVTSFGYLAVMEIPFRSLRYGKQFPQTWGVNIERSIKHKDEVDYWSPVYRDRRGFLNQAGKMTGLENITRRRNYELIPYVFLSRTENLGESGTAPSFVKHSTAKAGLDIKYGITSDLTASVTINPDFNDLEADQPRMRFNRRFRDSADTFVPEKRPFFLERADIFATPLNVFFTRKIIDPVYGAKLSGKAGPYSIGFLSAKDGAPDRGFDDDAGLFRRSGRQATINALRVRRDLYEQSSVGVIAVDRQWGDTFNRLYGVDANFRFLEKYELTLQHIRSQARTVKDGERARTLEHLQGSGTMLTLARSARHLSLDAYYMDLSPGFRADLGFIERVNVKQFGGAARYDFWPEGDYLINWAPKISYGRSYDYQGHLNDNDVDFGVAFTLAGNTSLELKAADRLERFADRVYRKHPVGVYASTERTQKISGGLGFTYGSEINYQKNDPFLGRGSELAFDLTLRPNEHLKVMNVYLASHLANREIPNTLRGFDAHIFQTRINYQFNREFAVRFIPEFEFLRTKNLLGDDTLARTSERTRNLRGSFLFSYMLRPGTVLFVGYDSVFQDLEWGTTRRFRPSDRGFFFKLSYLYR